MHTSGLTDIPRIEMKDEMFIRDIGRDTTTNHCKAAYRTLTTRPLKPSILYGCILANIHVIPISNKMSTGSRLFCVQNFLYLSELHVNNIGLFISIIN